MKTKGALLVIAICLGSCASHKQIIKKSQCVADTLVTELVSESARKFKQVDFRQWLVEMDAVLTREDSVVEFTDSVGRTHSYRKTKLALKKKEVGSQAVVHEVDDTVKDLQNGKQVYEALQKEEQVKNEAPSIESQPRSVSWKLLVIMALIVVWLLGLYKSTK